MKQNTLPSLRGYCLLLLLLFVSAILTRRNNKIPDVHKQIRNALQIVIFIVFSGS